MLRALSWGGHDGAARFMLLTAARREEVVGAVWAEVDLERGTWTIPASRRKDTRAPSRRRRRAASDHLVRLSRQARALLETLGTGNPGDLVFVGGRGAKLALPIHDDLRFRAFAAFGTSGRTGSFGFFTA